MPNFFRGSFLITGTGFLLAPILDFFELVEFEKKVINWPEIVGYENVFMGGIGVLLVGVYLFFLWLDNGSGSYMSPSKEERKKSKDEWLK